jgi:RimJ/RimL family protein N-acetyltransferase
MTLKESAVPLSWRILYLEGALDAEAFALASKGLPSDAVAAECFWASFAYADLPVPHVFDIVFKHDEPRQMERLPLTVRAVTQQWAKPFSEIPHGWKTILWLGSTQRSPLVRALPLLREWDFTVRICLTKEATWAALTDGSTRLVTADDDDFAWMIRGTPARRRGLTLPPEGVDRRDILEHVRDIARKVAEREGWSYTWMIVANFEVVGLCGLKRAPVDGEGVEIGYSVSPSRRRRGHAKRAVSDILRNVRSDQRIPFVIAETTLDNIASQRVLAENGFVNVGIANDPDDGSELIRWRVETPFTPRQLL